MLKQCGANVDASVPIFAVALLLKKNLAIAHPSNVNATGLFNLVSYKLCTTV